MQAWHISLIKVNNRYETRVQGKVIRALNPINVMFATLFHFNNFFTAHADAAFPRKFICTYSFLSVNIFFNEKFKHYVFGVSQACGGWVFFLR